MAYGQLNVVLAHLRRLVHQPGAGVDDGVLLERFVRQRDEAAFEVLVWRHGPMVLSLARRLLRSPHDAEDVLQATFLTLVRKANSISKRESTASWLYKVAYRIALRARVRAVRLPVPAGFLEHIPAPVAEAVDPELRSLLDKAILRLPEKYRTAIVLCHLEGKSVGEVATQLGCPLGTVSARLTRGRELLRKQLSRNGAALPSGALAALLCHEVASSAVPTALVLSTLRAAWALATGQAAVGSVSANVAALIESASAGTILSKLSLGAAVVAAGFLAIGASALARREAPAPAVQAKPAGSGTDTGKQADPSRAPSAKPPSQGGVVVTGRVLDPDGKPVSGARLYYPRWPKTADGWATDYGETETPERGRTASDGRFRIELPRSDMPPDQEYFLVAAADGYGMDGAKIPKGESLVERTLRLVRDRPIEGKILNSEGRPLSGVEVIVQGVVASPQERLDEFLEAWRRDWFSAGRGVWNWKSLHLPGRKISRSVATDKDGSFRLTGVGTERMAMLLIKGPGIAQAPVYVLTRDGFDPAPYNHAAQNEQPPQSLNGPPPLLYGPKFIHVAAPGRAISGTVHEFGSQKPVAGVVIIARAGLGTSDRGVSDAQGRYHLTGLPQRKTYWLWATPDAKSSLLRKDVEVADTVGTEPIRVDIELTRGVTLSGRLIDKETGKGVRGFVQFSPGDPFEQKSPTKTWTQSRTDDTGFFQLKVLTGKGYLWGQASPVPCGVGRESVLLYRRVRLDPGDRRMFATNFYEKLDVAEGVTSLTRDLYLDPGKTVRVHVQDPDGKPLTGTTVVNLADFSGNNAVTFAEAECPVYALDPATPRRVLFYHATRNLVGSLTLQGDEKEPPVARLAPAGAVTGRVLDRDGHPVIDADIYPRFQERSFDDLYWRAHEKQWFRTNKEGRFRLGGIVPNVKLRTLEFRKGREQLVAEPWKKPASVAPGETLDVGDIHAKPP
jgi:RNA polymerase sigma factor (sigma-70 family)